jgi:uncharacterized protein
MNGIFFVEEQNPWLRVVYITRAGSAMAKNNIFNNELTSRFEFKSKGEVAYLDYKWHKNTMVLMHTFVPVSLRGKGLSFDIAKFALDHAVKKNIKLVIECPQVARYFKLHPEYNTIVKRISLREEE